ncbi:hypothetical protein O9993_00720 [Vibrio lentus]|nr:hypothetical protein [Vibrio lentus]
MVRLRRQKGKITILRASFTNSQWTQTIRSPFYIPADSLPEGVEISGDGVIVEC